MAKGKRIDNLSFEEKLQLLLIPENVQPYEVPENWCWIKLENLVSIATGKKDANYGSKDGEYYFFTCASEPIRCSEYSFEGKAILLAGNGDIGNISLYNGKFEAYQRTYILENCKYISEEYLYYYLKCRWVDYNKDKIFGTTIPYIRLGNLKEYEVPIPPILEQQRIVEQIENLFSKLDEAKEKIQAVIDESENRKAAILHKAFSGELTEKWRVSKNKSREEWKSLRFGEVADIKSNLVSPNEYLEFPHIAPDNIEKYTGRLLEYRAIEEDKVISGKHRFYAGQILYSKIRPYLSKVIIIDFDGLCSADMYPIEAKENTKYLWYYMLSDLFLEQATTAGSRSVLPKINQKELSKIKINIPSEEEQIEISELLDVIFLKEQTMKENAEESIELINMMRKSILAKAFRGELGTNNPEETSSVELLKEILITDEE
ncbi:MAG: restriction endonuclease subunit S [Sulfurospirillaceae bacterium]|nr:restriction endonuclease subunit S [Sulfurospirillaceae bacterium]